ncbi:MAG: hypothetical protein ACIAXF_10990 [Phycisphaerales bacterium JB063]
MIVMPAFIIVLCLIWLTACLTIGAQRAFSSGKKIGMIVLATGCAIALGYFVLTVWFLSSA